MKISIIVPTLNEGKYLPTLLESIKRQGFENYEVIVADSNSTDNTRDAALQYGAKIVEGGKPAVGRNNGARVATGDFLFFIDADVELPEGFLKNATEEIEERFLDLATCEFIPASELRFDKVLHSFSNLFIKIYQFTPTPHSGGACIMVSRRLFNRVGGFDESLQLSEDHDFVQRASEFRNLRVLRSTYILLSTRRLDKEGRLGLMKKYAFSEITNITKGLIPNLQEYEFAKYDDIKIKKFDKNLIKFEKNLDELNERYKKILNTNIRIDPFERDDSKEEKELSTVKTDLQKEIQKFLNLFKNNEN